MRILAFSDLHCDLDTAESLVARSREADLVVGAGDYANEHHGLEPTIRALAAIETPAILIPGNNETEDELRAAVDSAGWGATVLHGETAEVDGTTFFGLGAGIPTTPWDWSFDLTEEEAATALASCPEGAVLIVHSPPKDHCDSSSQGLHLGSSAILVAIEEKRPPLAVCGHIHESWGQRSVAGPTEIANLGPQGATFDVGGDR